MKFEVVESTFDEIFETHSNLVLNTAMRCLGDSYLAEDIMQETFCAYFEYEKKDEIDNVSGWLVRVAKNKSLNLLKKKYHECVDEDIQLTSDLNCYAEAEKSSAENIVLEREEEGRRSKLCKNIYKDLEENNSNWNKAARLIYIKGHSQVDASKAMNMKENAFYGMTSRMRKWLKNRWEQDYNEI